MEINIIEFSQEKARLIAELIMKKYDESDFSVESNSIRKEIYKRASHEAEGFFLYNEDAILDNRIIEDLKFRLSIRLENPRVIKKMKIEDMLANVIDDYVVDFLLKNNIVL